jgi:hypothetical protein
MRLTYAVNQLRFVFSCFSVGREVSTNDQRLSDADLPFGVLRRRVDSYRC